MNFLFVDTETVDITQNTNRPINDIDNWSAIRQIAWIVCDEYRNIIRQHNYVIGSTHPIDNTVENYYPQEIKPIHRIIPLLMQDLESCVYLIGHNVEYDAKVIAAEMFRLGYDTHAIETIQQICTMQCSVDFCCFAGRNDSRYPKLQELYTKLFHEPFIQAHDAYCDIFATYKCFWALVDRSVIRKSDYEELYTQQELEDYINTLSTKVTDTDTDKDNVKKDHLGVTYSADWKRLITTRDQYGSSVLKNIENYSIAAGVEVICDRAFWYEKNLRKLVIPKSVKKIGEAAFYFCNKANIVCYSPHFGSIISEPNGYDLYDKVNHRIISFFDYGIEYPNLTTRSYCSWYLGTVYIKNTYKESITIGAYAFAGSSIVSAIIGEGVTLERDAFNSCESLAAIHLPGTMTELPDRVLYNCHKIQSIIFPNNLIKVGASALSGCSALKSISFPKSVLEIGDYAFSSCKGITEVEIPEAVSHIGKGTFANCDNLESIEIRSNIKSIDSNPFIGCTRLKIIGSQRFVFQDGALYDEVEKRLISYIGNSNSYTVRSGTLYIGDNAFYNCISLSAINLPDSVISIGGKAFYGCKNLQSINLPNSVISIGEAAFYSCENLQSISLPSSIKTIEQDTFYGCKSIQKLSIPHSVAFVEDYALRGCSSMTDLYLSNPKIDLRGMFPFSGCDSLTNIYVPDGTIDQFMRNYGSPAKFRV